MPSRACSAYLCTNNSKKLLQSKKELCSVHHKLKGKCGCLPFKHFKFPKDEKNRKIWSKLINRQMSKTDKTPWQPNDESVICSKHFVDNMPTESHPNPTLELGYALYNTHSTKRATRTSTMASSTELPNTSVTLISTCQTKSVLDSELTEESEIFDVSEYARAKKSQPKQDKNKLLSTGSLNENDDDVNALPLSLMKAEKELKLLKGKYFVKLMELKKASKHLAKLLSPIYKQLLKTDRMCKFYTNIPNTEMFLELCKYTAALQKKNYQKNKQFSARATWLVSRRRVKNVHFVPVVKYRKTTLCHNDCILMTLMKLRLALLHRDLAQRFGLSTRQVSQIFNQTVKLLGEALNPMIVFYQQTEVNKTIPPQYEHYKKLRCIIDCSEIFIQKPADLKLQSATWSDYKHHNTIKFLVAITPQGSVAYKSQLWGGRTSDKHIVLNSSFLKHLNPTDQVLADRGFSIVKEAVMMKGCELVVPPPLKGRTQMTSKNIGETKKVANVRIHVERVIQRIKTFKLINNVVPVSLIGMCDDILTICCAITNMQGPIVKEWDEGI